MTATAEPHTEHAGDAGAARLPWSDHATILDLLDERAASTPGRVALRARGEQRWDATTWGEYGRAVRQVAAGLYALGVAPGDRVAILSFNRPEWHVADFAVLWSGAVTVPIYPTSAPEQVEYVLRHSGSRVCFVERSPTDAARCRSSPGSWCSTARCARPTPSWPDSASCVPSARRRSGATRSP
jgi:long-chain acyl-CoA synthetase